MHVLMVGVPQGVETSLSQGFHAERYTTEVAQSADDAMGLARYHEFSLILISLQLPDLNGSELIRRLRASRVNLPIIALSPGMRPEPRVAALSAGADDVVTVPIDGAELIARVRAIVRRNHGHSRSTLMTGAVSVCLETHEVSVNGRILALTSKETAILELLMLRRNIPISKETFLNQLYSASENQPNDKIIDVFICKIRKKFAIAGVPDLIATMWGRGYMIRDPRQEKCLPVQPSLAPQEQLELAS